VKIPHSRPTLGPLEEEALLRVLRSKQIGPGREKRGYEEELCRLTGRAHALAVQSGSAALQLVLRARGIGPGDEVIVPSYVCAALLHAVEATGARPIPADVEPRTGNLSPRAAASVKTPRSRAAAVVHLFGLPARIEALGFLAPMLIEDCAMCLGTQRLGKRVGSWGSCSILSSYATKMLATGQGGAILTDDEELHRTCLDLVSHDERDTHRLRFNYAMSDLQAALGRVQAARLQEFVRGRRAVARRYFEALAGLDLGLPPRDDEHVYYRFVVQTAGRDLPEIIRRAAERDIELKRPVYRPLHHYLKLDPGNFPNAERLWNESLSLPCYPSLREEEQQQVIDFLKDIL
jgi:dTDP-4-amino-4,6-dideoxygalactose transaminase